jgi:hydroxymethylpyrimidine/phosphomethylpyrimidine kinase
MRIALTIAGSDSGGGAGIQADLKTFQAFGVFGTSAITAVTAQNTLGVSALHPVPAVIVRAQIHAVATDLRPVACKTGMLATAELVATVADAIAEETLGNVVVDPVMVATSGHRLLDASAQRTIIERLLPIAVLVTPNLHEAGILTGVSIGSEADMIEAGRRLVAMGAPAVLVKGGHLEGAIVVDVLVQRDRVRQWRRPRLATKHTHGTGCTLSAAIAAGLALGQPLDGAIDTALDFVARAIAASPRLGRGNGPLNHFIEPRDPTSTNDSD